jgi:hypothetical protein
MLFWLYPGAVLHGPFAVKFTGCIGVFPGPCIYEST